MPEPIPFAQVLDEELRLIEKRRQFVDFEIESAPELGENLIPPTEDADRRMMELRVLSLKEHTTGLTFSGGGIRAGTFAVGILQGLATLGLLRRIDYLSTVSGGGYAGGWVAAWLKRQGDVENVERQLNPNRVAQSRSNRLYLHGQVVDEEPEPVRHLRAYSSYMTPRPGLLTPDTWTILMIWSRNIIINLTMLLPLALLVVLAARSVVYFYQLHNPLAIGGSIIPMYMAIVTLGGGGLVLAIAFAYNASCLREFRRKDPALRPDGKKQPGRMTTRVVYPIFLAAILITNGVRAVLWHLGDQLMVAKSSWLSRLIAARPGLLDYPNIVGHLVVFGLLFALGAALNGVFNKILKWRYVYSAFFAGATGGVLFTLLEALIKTFASVKGYSRPDLMAVFAPPLTILVIIGAFVVEVALVGRSIEEAEREWWSRFSALIMISALLWMFGMATILYVPILFLWSPGLFRLLLVSGWLGSAAFAVISGRFVLPRLGSGGGLSLTALASAASLFFLVGLMGLTALLINLIIDNPSAGTLLALPTVTFRAYMEGLSKAWIGNIALVALFCAMAAALARKLIDVNLFSINAMYANRLIRCYLGASRRQAEWQSRWQASPRDSSINTGTPAIGGVPQPGRSNDPLLARDANPVTGFDPKDDFDLIDLRIGLPGLNGERKYWGPHLLLNTTLNLIGQDNLAWRDRKGESFLLSPLYCGSKGTGYARLPEAVADRPNMTLGRAISISGAAIDPNMACYQSASLTALLTVFNARLGYWLEKPKPEAWKACGPQFGDLLLTEFLGQTNTDSDFVHITDGGHFENLGVYELIRRRCRYIIVIDSGEDTQAADDNMSIMIRLCRIDFGVRVHLDARPLEMVGPDKLTKAHVVIGQIHYDDVDQGEMPGVMVYIKVSLTGDEPPDLLKYAQKEPAFPHQSTDFRQSFDEEQFESYRCLGDHIAREVFGDAAQRFHGIRSTPHKEFVPLLFSAVQARWTETIDAKDDRLMSLERAWGDLHGKFRESPALAHLSHDLYPELPAPTAIIPPDVRERAELHAVIQMLELMSNAWLALNLRNSHDLPGKRGWLNTFRRWVSTRAFQKYWPLVRSEYDSDFVRFCESELHLAIAGPQTIRLPWPLPTLPANSFEAEAIQLLDMEFAREWPEDVRNGRSLPALIQRAEALQTLMGSPHLPVWLIIQAPSGLTTASQSSEKSVVGIILAATFPDHPVTDDPRFQGTTPIEFFAWVRRPFRAVSMGSPTVRGVLNNEFLPSLRANWKDPQSRPVLWTRYPKRSADGDNDLEGGIWLNFYARFDFRKYVPMKPEDAAWTLLVREL